MAGKNGGNGEEEDEHVHGKTTCDASCGSVVETSRTETSVGFL